jgi:Tfp pilus assembly protein PilV
MFRRREGMSLVEVVIAITLLAATIFFIFEILVTSYSYTNKMKHTTKLTKLTQEKIEDIMYLNSASDTGWTAFTGEPEFQFRVTKTSVAVDALFPEYKVHKVTVETKGPVGRVNVPEYSFSLSTYLLDESQNVTSVRDPGWGSGFFPAGPAKVGRTRRIP